MHSAKCIKLHVNLLTLFLAGIVFKLFSAEKHWRQQDATASKTAPLSLLLTFAVAKTNQEIQSTCKETVRTQPQHFFNQIYLRSPNQFRFPWAGGQHCASITSGCAIPLSLLPHLHSDWILLSLFLQPMLQSVNKAGFCRPAWNSLRYSSIFLIMRDNMLHVCKVWSKVFSSQAYPNFCKLA